MNGANKLSGVRGLPIGLPIIDGLLVHSQKRFLARKKESMLANSNRLGGVAAGSKKADKESGQNRAASDLCRQGAHRSAPQNEERSSGLYSRRSAWGVRAGAKRANVAYSPSKRSLAAACYTRRRKLESHSALCSTSAKKGRHSRCNTRTCLLLRSRATKSSQTSKQKTAFSRLQHSPRKLGGRPSSTSKVRLRFRRSGPSTPTEVPAPSKGTLFMLMLQCA